MTTEIERNRMRTVAAEAKLVVEEIESDRVVIKSVKPVVAVGVDTTGLSDSRDKNTNRSPAEERLLNTASMLRQKFIDNGIVAVFYSYRNLLTPNGSFIKYGGIEVRAVNPELDPTPVIDDLEKARKLLDMILDVDMSSDEYREISDFLEATK